MFKGNQNIGKTIKDYLFNSNLKDLLTRENNYLSKSNHLYSKLKPSSNSKTCGDTKVEEQEDKNNNYLFSY